MEHRIKITLKDLTIERDEHQWIIKRSTEKSTKIVGYYPKLEDAAARMLKMRIDAEAKGDLKEVIAIIARCKAEVIEAIKTHTMEPVGGVQVEEQDDECDW